MPKRGNEHAQVAKEDLDAVLAKSSSDEPKGPFERASGDVLKRRKIVKLGRKFGAAKMKAPASSSSKAPPSNSIFSSVSMSNSTTAAASGRTNGGTQMNPFGNFSFGATAAAPSASSSSTTKKVVPFFAAPGSSTQLGAPKTALANNSNSFNNNAIVDTTENDETLIKCAQGFLKHMKSLSTVNVVSYQGFIRTFASIAQHVEETATSAPGTKATTTTTKVTGKTGWDSSRPLFGGGQPLVSPGEKKSGATPTTKPNVPMFGASAPSPAPATGGFSFNPSKSGTVSPAPATGGFSFNPTKSAAAPATGEFSFNPAKCGAAAAPVPAFSFSTTPTAAVKAAAKSATASTDAPKPENTEDDANKEEDGDTELGTAKENEDYEVLYKTKTKILHVKKAIYIKGVLKLEKHKTTGKSRLVVRDGTVGKVKMNTAITKGMPLSKTVVPATKKKAATPVVLIKAIFDETSKDELEDFKIITAMEEHENLYNELKKLV